VKPYIVAPHAAGLYKACGISFDRFSKKEGLWDFF